MADVNSTTRTPEAGHQALSWSYEPERLLSLRADMPPGWPLDPMRCTLERLKALAMTMEAQYDGSGDTLSESARLALACTLRGQVDVLRQLFEHGCQGEIARGQPPGQVPATNPPAPSRQADADAPWDELCALRAIGDLLAMVGAQAPGFDGVDQEQAAALGIAVRILSDKVAESFSTDGEA